MALFHSLRLLHAVIGFRSLVGNIRIAASATAVDPAAHHLLGIGPRDPPCTLILRLHHHTHTTFRQIQAPPAPPSARSPRLAKPPHRTCSLRPRLATRAHGEGSPPHAAAAPSQLRLLLHFRPTPSPRGISPSQLRLSSAPPSTPKARALCTSSGGFTLQLSPRLRSSGFSSCPPRLGLRRDLVSSR
jgi:hypothetical protein